jgi:hypothetical protein
VIVLAASSSSVLNQPGTLAFLVVFGMGVAVYFLLRSMSKHLRKVNAAARAESVQAESVQAGPSADTAATSTVATSTVATSTVATSTVATSTGAGETVPPSA